MIARGFGAWLPAEPMVFGVERDPRKRERFHRAMARAESKFNAEMRRRAVANGWKYTL